METQKSKLGLYRIVQKTEYVEKNHSNATWLKPQQGLVTTVKKSH